MKKLSISTLAVIALMAVSSCSKIADILTVDVPTDVSVDLKIPGGSSELKSSGGMAPFDVSETLDIATNPTVIQYQAKIKSIAANGGTVTVKLPGTTPPVMLKDAKLEITNLDTQVILGTWSLESKLYPNGGEVTIGAPTSGSFADISAALDAKAKVKIRLTGSTDFFTAWIMTVT